VGQENELDMPGDFVPQIYDWLTESTVGVNYLGGLSQLLLKS
jgi:hypothetical protein